MLVRELIEQLQALNDPDARVMTRGYEGGYCDPDLSATPEEMVLDVNRERFYGPHEKWDEDHYRAEKWENKPRARAYYLG